MPLGGRPILLFERTALKAPPEVDLVRMVTFGSWGRALSSESKIGRGRGGCVTGRCRLGGEGFGVVAPKDARLPGL